MSALDGAPFALSDLRGQWVLLIVTGADCTDACERALYATRQARTIQGREQDRVVRAWLRPTGAPAPATELRDPHPGLVIASVGPGGRSRDCRSMPGGAPTILLIDPRGNLVLRYGADPGHQAPRQGSGAPAACLADRLSAGMVK